MTTHAYWRLYITASQGNPTGKTYWHSIAEIQMRATPGGADQCSGGTATAHNYYSGSYAPSMAFDNSDATFWGSYPGSNPGNGWIQYQFASGVDVQELSITARNDPGLTDYAPKSFSLQWSDNNSTWTTLATWENLAGWAQGETRLFQPPVVVTNQSSHLYGVRVEITNGQSYGDWLARAQLNSRYSDWSDIISGQRGLPYDHWQSLGQVTSPYEEWWVDQQWTTPYEDDRPTVTLLSPYDDCQRVDQQEIQIYEGKRLEQTLTCPLFDRVEAQRTKVWSLRGVVTCQTGMVWWLTSGVTVGYGQPWDLLDHDPVAGQMALCWNMSSPSLPVVANGQLQLWQQGVRL
ncbi:MAG: discoidin domain-containing protein [Magnetococcales bacterium]|nr:discoidin domain-containing protein [Magnetococcales bacterium]NGZ26772.1 discoidin domain-containing protein [Magnetococcales bacterium]